MEDNEISYPACKYNEGVCCWPQNNCQHCGWYPPVANARLESICSTMGVTVPEKATEER